MRATFLSLVAVLIVACHSAVANASFVFGPITTFGANSFQPVLAADGVTWGDANTAANSQTFDGRSGHLAVVDSTAVNNYVAGLVSNTSYWTNEPVINSLGLGPWLGGIENNDPNIWSWVTAPSTTFTSANFLPAAWCCGQPDGGNPQPQGLLYFAGGTLTSGNTWGDYPQVGVARLGLPTGFVVEFNVPEPSAIVQLSLLGIALGLLYTALADAA